jgi:IrrE N-terminal-like domain
MRKPADIRAVLQHSHVELNPEAQWPIDLQSLLSRLGIELRVSNDKAAFGKAYLIPDEPPTIVLSARSNRKLSQDGVDRFSIAHELAHWIVWRRLGFAPAMGSEYWDNEILCNEFAAELLVPKRRLVDFVAVLRARRVNPVYFPAIVAQAAKVSWDVAARAISALAELDLSYVRLSSSAGSSKTVVTCSTVSNKSGSFLGNRAYLRDLNLIDWLKSRPVDRVADRSVSVKFGALEIVDVKCAFLRERAFGTRMQFVMQFASSAVLLKRAEIRDPSEWDR